MGTTLSIKLRKVFRSPLRSQPKSLLKVSTSKPLVRSPRKSANGASPSLIRARVSAIRANISSSKKVRRSKDCKNGKQQTGTVPQAPPARPEQTSQGQWRQDAPVGAPFEQEHQRTADRRRQRRDPGFGVNARKRSGRGWQEQRRSGFESGRCNRRACQESWHRGSLFRPWRLSFPRQGEGFGRRCA